jgi:hypothetical protein
MPKPARSAEPGRAAIRRSATESGAASFRAISRRA